MIRSALIALGLSAGAAEAQGLVQTAPLLETCGGVRLVLEAEGEPETDDLVRASEVVSRRIGGVYSNVFDYADVSGNQIDVSVPAAATLDLAAIEPLLARIEFGFFDVKAGVATDDAGAAKPGQLILPDAARPEQSYVLNATPILDGTALASAQAAFDYNNRPAVEFRFDDAGAAVFAQYTASHIGEPFAIALAGEVISAPTIQSAITGGSGIITGNYTVEETNELAAILQGGVLPFDLSILAQEVMDGSDPSADFCP